MSKGPKISIITACFNAEKTIEQTIRSVLSQTYDNSEYIIVDGASTDGTMEIVNKYKDQIDIIISEPDKGIYDAFNKGISNSNGEVIYFLNADDVFYDQKVLIDAMNQYIDEKEISILYGNVEYIDKINGKIHFWNRKIDLATLKKGHMPHHQATFFNRKLFSIYGLYSTEYKLASDFEFTIRYFESCINTIKYFDRNIAKFTVGGASTSVSYGKKSWKDEANEILKKIYNLELPNNPLSDNYALLKMWLELSLKNISIVDADVASKKIALFGTGDICILVLKELAKLNIQPVVLIDNDSIKSGKFINNIKICLPENIRDCKLDMVILSSEGNYDEEMKLQLKEILKDDFNDLHIISWKELIVQSYNSLFID